MPDRDLSSGAKTRGSAAASALPALAVALDLPSAAEALAMASRLRSFAVWMKVGLELFTAEGPSLVKQIAGMGFPVFLDLKYHDIPNTVQGAVRSATRLGVGMITLHLAGGEAMCAAALAGREQALGQGGSVAGPLLMGITVLTSQGGDAGSIRESVRERALQARAFGLDGVVCSGLEAGTVKEACGADFLCLCPGIRFADGGGGDDQARICTPAQAVRAGADFLVMGRPIILSDEPEKAACAALEDMRKAFSQGQR